MDTHNTMIEWMKRYTKEKKYSCSNRKLWINCWEWLNKKKRIQSNEFKRIENTFLFFADNRVGPFEHWPIRIYIGFEKVIKDNF